jgi:hypothetical protein
MKNNKANIINNDHSDWNDEKRQLYFFFSTPLNTSLRMMDAGRVRIMG